MYYVLEQDKDRALVASLEENNPGHDLKWIRGSMMDERDIDEKIGVQCEENAEDLPDYFETLRGSIVSAKVLNKILNKNVSNIQYYPVIVTTGDKKEVEGYYIINIVGSISCFDFDKSKYTEWEGDLARIKSLSIDERRVRGEKIFRMQEEPSVILVNEELKKELLGCTGLYFVEAEGWSDSIRF